MVLCVQNSDFRSRIKSLCGSQTSPMVFASKSYFWTRITSFYESQILPVILCMQNNVISTRITSLYWFQPSSVVLYVQKSDFRTRIACLYGSQTTPVILCLQNSVPSIGITSLYGTHPSSVVFGCKTTTFGPE